MSAPPRADFVAGCPDCGRAIEADHLEAVACFYACHRSEGHDVEWMWGEDPAMDVEPDVTEAGTVENLADLIDALESTFDPVPVPGELLYETCLSAGAAKSALDDQLDQLPQPIADRVTTLD